MTRLNDLFDLTGRYAMLTGANGGVGRVFADTLAQLNCNLILVDLPETSLYDFGKSLKLKYKIEVKILEKDLEVERERDELILEICNGYQSLSILINCAALVGTSKISGWNDEFEGQTLSTWRRALEVNLTSIFHLCQGVYPILKRSISPTIINIGSIYGVNGPDWRLYKDLAMSNPAAYAASKGGLLQLTRWLATTLAPAVRVNAISPGGILRGQPKKFIERYERKTPLNRMATEDDLRGALIFLSTDLSSYVTGQNIVVDGGWGIW